MSEPIKLKDVRHILHVAVILVVLIGGFIAVRSAVVPKSFGEFGHYRGASLQERMALPVVFQGAETCKECHEDERGDLWPGYVEWQKGKHSALECENCHTNAAKHVERRRADPTAEEFVVTKDPSPKLCLTCHDGVIGRPKVLPLHDPKEHAEYLEMLEKDESTRCIECHEDYRPHNPEL